MRRSGASRRAGRGRSRPLGPSSIQAVVGGSLRGLRDVAELHGEVPVERGLERRGAAVHGQLRARRSRSGSPRAPGSCSDSGPGRHARLLLDGEPVRRRRSRPRRPRTGSSMRCAGSCSPGGILRYVPITVRPASSSTGAGASGTARALRRRPPRHGCARGRGAGSTSPGSGPRRRSTSRGTARPRGSSTPLSQVTSRRFAALPTSSICTSRSQDRRHAVSSFEAGATLVSTG